MKMKLSVHICSFINENYQERFRYLKKITKHIFEISKDAKIFIHTNLNVKKFQIKKIKYIVHNLKNEDPFYLSWKCRKLMKKQKNNFDYFIYLEDDMLLKKKNFEYWMANKDICLKNNLNLGFIRLEKKRNKYYSTDLTAQLEKYIEIGKDKYIVNDVNNYCAFWIYDQKEFNNFVQTKYWKFNWKGKNLYAFYGIREMSAIGWHGKNMDRYSSTVLPLKDKRIDGGAYIMHMANNYACTNHYLCFGSIEKKKILKKKLTKFSKDRLLFFKLLMRQIGKIFRKIL